MRHWGYFKCLIHRKASGELIAEFSEWSELVSGKFFLNASIKIIQIHSDDGRAECSRIGNFGVISDTRARQNGALASPPQHTHCFRLQSFFTREVSRARANILLPRGYGGNSSSIANRDGDEHSIPGRSFIFSILPLFSRSVVIHLFVHSAFFSLSFFLNSHYECRLDI